LRAENLEDINLIGNYIGAERVLIIVKANWGKISKINFGNIILIKATIKSETKDAII
jgi:hypothetical protein